MCVRQSRDFRRIAKLVEVERNQSGPRLRVMGQRIHHGMIGSLLTLSLIHHHSRLALIGVALMADDFHDARAWYVLGAQRS
jgi:hypothetical protein